LVRLNNGSVPALPRALAQDLGFDYAALQADLSAPAPAGVGNLQFVTRNLQLPASPCRTCGDVVELLSLLSQRLIQECLAANSSAAARRWLIEDCKFQPANDQFHCELTVEFLWKTVWPRLKLCRQEIDHVLAALAGRFVPPGPSGAPTRGTADIL